MTHATRHVILGAGTAGITAAETLRLLSPGDDILLIGDELDRPYSRAALPAWIAGAHHEDATALQSRLDRLRRQNVRLRVGRAQQLQLSRNESSLGLQDGMRLPFDKLLIATGAAPRLPVIAGITTPGVHPCWSHRDAEHILPSARPGMKVLLIGAGLIGMRLMEALLSRGVDLTVVEKRLALLPGSLSPGAGALVQQWCEARGVRVCTGTRVTRIARIQDQREQAPLIMHLDSGEQLRAEVVVCCTGASPRIGFLEGSGVRCAQGVLVDQRMQTSYPNIHAAGDCAQSWDADLGRYFISGTQANAADQGYCAALNMTGRRAFQISPRRVEEFTVLGLACSSFGRWPGAPGGQWVEYRDAARYRYLRLEFSGEMLVGCSAVGMREQAAIACRLIHQKLRLGDWMPRLLKEPLRLEEALRAGVERAHTAQASAFT